jgi:hypothetical protein
MNRSPAPLRSIEEDLLHFGVMIWQACAVRQPGPDPPGEMAIFKKLFDGEKLDELSKRYCPDWLKELMLQCVDRDPTKRPKIKEVVVGSRPSLIVSLLSVFSINIMGFQFHISMPCVDTCFHETRVSQEAFPISNPLLDHPFKVKFFMKGAETNCPRKVPWPATFTIRSFLHCNHVWNDN